jgi:hypothetical protein
MDKLKVGEKVTLRHPALTRLNGLRGVVTLPQGDHYRVSLVTGERVTLHRQYLISEHYNNDAKITVQELEYATGWYPKVDTRIKAIT